jgi:hypothetical protein
MPSREWVAVTVMITPDLFAIIRRAATVARGPNKVDTFEGERTPRRFLKVASTSRTEVAYLHTPSSSWAPMSDSRAVFFSRLFTESHAGLRRYVRRLVRSRDTADEIVQEAFLRTYEHGQTSKAPKAFLYTIARNLATDHRRRDRVAQTDTVGDLDVPDVLPQCESLEARLLADERTERPRRAAAAPQRNEYDSRTE